MTQETSKFTPAARLAVCVAVALVLRYGPSPAGLDPVGWNVFSVFAAVIVGFLVRPMAMGPLVLAGLVALSAAGDLTLKQALSGFGDTTVWLVVSAFLISGSVLKTGFGRRIALMLVIRLGKSTLGLGYAMAAAELILGPIVPSNTARGGGILAPIANSLCEALDSYPERGAELAGSYLTLVGAHTNLIAAAMFLTGMAANPLVSKAAMDVFQIDFGWGTWLLGAILPGLCAMALLPLLLYKLNPPQLTDGEPARERARQELKRMGVWSYGEKTMACVFAILILLWTTKPLHGMGTTLVALIGVCILLFSRADSWENMTRNEKAWDTFIWLGGLLAMANALKDTGFVGWFAQTMQDSVSGLDGMLVVLVLALIYFYSMYAFSMLTAHISALAAAFFAVALASGAPPMVTVVLIACFSNLCACTTNYSTGPVIIYYGLGYVPSNRWFAIGFLVSLFHLTVWLGLGLPWWKLLGWW